MSQEVAGSCPPTQSTQEKVQAIVERSKDATIKSLQKRMNVLEFKVAQRTAALQASSTCFLETIAEKDVAMKELTSLVKQRDEEIMVLKERVKEYEDVVDHLERSFRAKASPANLTMAEKSILLDKTVARLDSLRKPSAAELHDKILKSPEKKGPVAKSPFTIPPHHQ